MNESLISLEGIGLGSETIDAFADRDPFPFYARIRQTGQPVWDGKAGAWLVVDFDQCAIIERDESLFTNVYANADDDFRRIKGGGANITLSTGVEHDRLRRFHLRLLSPASVARYRDSHVQPIVNSMVRRLEGRDKAELVAEYASRIPARVIMSLLGMPYDDDDLVSRILHLNEEIVQLIAGGYRGEGRRERALAASAELNAMLLPFIRDRQQRSGDDFISRIWTEAPDSGIPMDEERALGLCREIYFAGSDTSVHGIASALYVLLADPALTARVRADPVRLLAPLVEESLRLYSVVQYRHRICLTDTVIGGVPIGAGETVILVHAAANRDPAKYVHADQADFARRSPTDHLAFGRGARSCVGAQLARVEIRTALETLLSRFSALALDPDAEQPRFRHLYIRSMGPLHAILR